LPVKPEERDRYEEPRHRWDDNIKMDLREIGRGGMTGFVWLWIGNETSGSIKFWGNLE
jgi:hypothetical protein